MTGEQGTPKKPRIIIMRHSERLDFVIRNPNWPSEVFINGVYSPNINQLPTILPTRTNPHEYILDTPLTRYGKAHAYHTGEFFRSVGLIPNRVYTSPAMRCIQTADSVLDGLGVRDKTPLRIDLALYEPTRKELPLQSANFFSSAGFNIDLKYRSLIPSNDSRIILNESRLKYYRRMYLILKRIIKKLTTQSMKTSSSPTILIVTHRSCVTLLAAMLNLDSVDDKLSYLNEIESNKRSEVNFLSMIIAEYDATTGLWTFLSDFPQISNIPSIEH
jgi:ubiquitin-associated SH3 domain-containing protein